MSVEQIIFYTLGVVLIAASMMVVVSRNPIHSALFLILSFFTASGIWLLLEAEFLAIALILVYVGAVMVLFLFVVMMLDVNLEELREGFAQYAPIAAIVGLAMLIELVIVVGSKNFGLDSIAEPARAAADASNVKTLGSVLYTQYVLQFEVAAVVLLVAIIAAITLTMRRRPETKYQNPAEQMRASKADRLRVVKMPSEKQG